MDINKWHFHVDFLLISATLEPGINKIQLRSIKMNIKKSIILAFSCGFSFLLAVGCGHVQPTAQVSNNSTLQEACERKNLEGGSKMCEWVPLSQQCQSTTEYIQSYQACIPLVDDEKSTCLSGLKEKFGFDPSKACYF